MINTNSNVLDIFEYNKPTYFASFPLVSIGKIIDLQAYPLKSSTFFFPRLSGKHPHPVPKSPKKNNQGLESTPTSKQEWPRPLAERF